MKQIILLQSYVSGSRASGSDDHHDRRSNAAITTRTATPTPRPRRGPRLFARCPGPRSTTTTSERRVRKRQRATRRALDIPNLSVDEITLEVDNLRAHVALDARLANLLQLTAGADVGIDKVKLTIKGVRAEVLLKVRLDNVASIIDRTLTTIDRNPQILERLLTSVDNTVNTVGGIANTALQPGGVLSQTVNTLGQTVQRTWQHRQISRKRSRQEGRNHD